MKKRSLAVLFFLFIIKVSAQPGAKTIEGTIINSSTSQPVPFVNITNLDAGEVVGISDKNGGFNLKINNFPVNLKFSAIGFESVERIIKAAEDNIRIYLFPETETLSEVMIRSTLISSELRKIPSAVSVISTEGLQRIDPTNFAQAFNNVPGVYVNQGALNTTKLNIRGIGARSQYSTNRIQAYFNGIPLTTAEGELTLDDIDPEALSRVEIIKGPTSSIYGAGLGGVINLYAGEAGEGTRTSVNTIFGSFEMTKKNFSASHGSENSSLFVNYSDLQTNGFRENGEYDRKSALVNASLKTNEGNRLNFLANFTRLKAFIPSSINEEDFRTNPSVAASNWAESRGYESYDRGLLGVSYQHTFSSSLSNITSLYLNFRDAFEPRPFDILKEERVSAGVRTRFNWETEIIGNESQLSFGAEFYNEWYEMGTFENLYRQFEDRGSVLGERLSNNEQDRNYTNIFGQLTMELSDRLFIEAGANINLTSYSLTDFYVQDEVDQTGDYSFKTILSPRIGATYEIAERKNIYASISHGFSTPTVAETLTPEGQINTNLSPETGINYEIGFKGNWLNNALYTEVALYSIQINNLLVAERVAEDRYVGVNAGETSHTGLEFFASYIFTPFAEIRVKPYLNATVNNFEFREFRDRDEDFTGNKLPGVPQSTVNLGLDLNWGNLTFFSNFLAVGEIPLNDANTRFTDNYSLVNLKADYNLPLVNGLNLEFTAGINNVLDENYAASVLPNAVGFGGAAPRYYYPGNPRNYFGGVGLNYLF